jgi:hypothetical protein
MNGSTATLTPVIEELDGGDLIKARSIWRRCSSERISMEYSVKISQIRFR